MSLYNMLFGRNSQTGLLLAVIGLRENDVERLRDVHVEDDGKTIAVYTRTGGNNRSDYANETLRHAPDWRRSEDDDFDNTYCTDYFDVPEQWVADVAGLSDIIGNGLRREFGQHLSATLNREPTESDKEKAAYDAETQALARTGHEKLNGHTFVPYDDGSLKVALDLAEANGGKLRTCWDIAPMKIVVRRDFKPYPNAKDPEMAAALTRIRVSAEWDTDQAYWQHVQNRFNDTHPLTLAEMRKSAEPRRGGSAG